MRPLIGMPCFAAKRAGTLRPIYAANQAYVQAIEEAGGVPILLPPFNDAQTLGALRGRLDGLLLIGGGDLDPACYGEQAIPQTQPPDTARDAFEMELIGSAAREGLPILGICRGMQVLNVARGGTLYQDIRAQVPGARTHDLSGRSHASQTHAIEIQPGSRLAAILGERHHMVNSYHHQAVHRPGEGVAIVAWAADGVPEALELLDHPFALAVQFHPERQYTTDPALRRLFEEFVRACQTSMAYPSRPLATPVGAAG
jgi:putative glutamine amidotransferase